MNPQIERRLCILLPISAVVLCVPGCMISSGIPGSGVLKTETREVASFDKVEVSGSAQVEIQCGADTELVLTIDDNLLDIITTKVENGTLKIGSSESYSTRKGLEVDLKTPELTALELSGAGSIRIVDCETESLTLEVSGASSLEVSGEVKNVTLRVSGVGSADLSKLVANKVEVDISGTGNAIVYPKEKLKATVSGMGSIQYKGNPTSVSKSISGVGSITRIQSKGGDPPTKTNATSTKASTSSSESSSSIGIDLDGEAEGGSDLESNDEDEDPEQETK